LQTSTVEQENRGEGGGAGKEGIFYLPKKNEGKEGGEEIHEVRGGVWETLQWGGAKGLEVTEDKMGRAQ